MLHGNSRIKSRINIKDGLIIIDVTQAWWLCFMKGLGHQGIFSLVKGTLWGNCKFLFEHFKGTKAITMGHDGLYCLQEVSCLITSSYMCNWSICLIFLAVCGSPSCVSWAPIFWWILVSYKYIIIIIIIMYIAHFTIELPENKTTLNSLLMSYRVQGLWGPALQTLIKIAQMIPLH